MKHLVDIDEAALAAARTELGTRTIRETVNVALRRVADDGRPEVEESLDALARVQFEDRHAAWR